MVVVMMTSQQTACVWHLVLLFSCSKHGWFDKKEACTKKIQRCWPNGPKTTIFENPVGGGGLVLVLATTRPPVFGASLTVHARPTAWECGAYRRYRLLRTSRAVRRFFARCSERLTPSADCRPAHG